MECEPKKSRKSAPARRGRTRLEAAARRPITLVGLMGAGKTSVGKRLAAKLGLPFVDADAEIELASGMTISEIFERFGEAHFRDGERRVIARLVDGETKVVATGGGAFMQDDTRALILARSVAVWLDADIDTLVARVGKRDSRPLLAGRDPGEVLRALAAERRPVYAQAHVRVMSGAGPHGEVVEAIIDALAQWNGDADDR
ncbi:MAG: shikimate kinase [Polymorphobacter sp.]|uniref:shikimate kinase n=1 Tax=Polymorphobacter sp. TaxID=1909290 RepID=UPI003A83AF0A